MISYSNYDDFAGEILEFFCEGKKHQFEMFNQNENPLTKKALNNLEPESIILVKISQD